MHDFQSRFVQLEISATALPFTVGGVTQHGPHVPEQNNQDAISLHVDNQSIVAVVCDGCAGASPNGRNTVSFNETGAHLLSVLAMQAVKKRLSTGVQPGAEMVALLERDIHDKYIQIVSLLAANDFFLREHILFEMLMSTIVGAVIGPNRWCVFHGGDGVVILNGELHNLNNHSGKYLANAIVLKERNGNPEAMLSSLREGETLELDNLLLGTDGVLDLTNRPGRPLEKLVVSLDRNSGNNNTGYDNHFFREFRKLVWNPLHGSGKPQGEHDDRSLILIRRLPIVPVQLPVEKATNGSPVTKKGFRTEELDQKYEASMDLLAVREGSDEGQSVDPFSEQLPGPVLPVLHEDDSCSRLTKTREVKRCISIPDSNEMTLQEQAAEPFASHENHDELVLGCGPDNSVGTQQGARHYAGPVLSYPELHDHVKQEESVDTIILQKNNRHSISGSEEDTFVGTKAVDGPSTINVGETPKSDEGEDFHESFVVSQEGEELDNEIKPTSDFGETTND